MHNPIRHAGHAVEEFFEAFWHLDGRLFRTLRDLVLPGRVAINYLAGHRARYIAPLRLFVVLSLLTFFIGSAAVHIEEGAVDVEGIEAITSAGTVEEVERVRDRMVGDIERARTAAGNTPGVMPSLVAAEVRIRGAAANRVVELGGRPKPGAAGADAGAPPAGPEGLQFNMLGHRGEWNARDNPVVVGWWPGFANDWLNRKIGNLEMNMRSLDSASADTWLQAVMSAAPSALFLLVPVFALLLKVAYLFTRRLYLEHLVVALYSHVFLLIMLSLAFVLSVLDGLVASTTANTLLGLGMAAVLLWMPLYLLLMQKRVYGQAWWLTLLKYLVLGFIYFMMLATATVLVFLARMTTA
ncbi:DUF3667 domain-containing protein [Luteimonas sp. MC1572]|uniref:DUF3667 domain-containing protein n=1 Tax=Luteimonas sp. MC1572 TaxID=2799325 RepID=UPI0018F08EC7|nr:DUF3667 domain-containing protein [Luteimonas sp. MC1572]MBJ6980896.1 DUF3667 domain-containing protein [Luteimonas sp. MC1572]QQO02254.1 DUF3667 domain-containing protein [Luteimonas sp. MC1572]